MTGKTFWCGIACGFLAAATAFSPATGGNADEPDHSNVPGVVIDASRDKQRVYFGCPSIAVLANGDYVASHSLFGPGTTYNRTRVFRSADAGLTWEPLTEIDGQWWSTLFVHRGGLYIMGVSRRYGQVVIRRSDDGGKTWTAPQDGTTGLLCGEGPYHTAPVPVVVHAGRIWRAMEDMHPKISWPGNFRAFVMSAPADADLLDAGNWTTSNRLRFQPEWLEAERPGWLEGNIVVTPEDKLVNILRLNDDRGDRAAIVRVSDDGRTISFDPEHDFIDLPGGRTKFTIRFDEATGRYWSLVNKQRNPEATRNLLVLVSSADLRDWEVEATILQHPDRKKVAFQYVDWLFEGRDIIAVSRTAFNDAHNFHDANYLTFHRVRDFRRARERAGRAPAADRPAEQ